MLGQSSQLETKDIFTLSNCSFALKGIKPGLLTYLLSCLEVSSDIETKLDYQHEHTFMFVKLAHYSLVWLLFTYAHVVIH